MERLSTTVEYLDMNVTKKPLDDVRVRQAIDYAINEQAIEDIMYRGTASYSPTTRHTGNESIFDDSDTDYRYDVKKAKTASERSWSIRPKADADLFRECNSS